MNQRLKYLGTGVTCQEVPSEISIVINISGCPHKCEGCHSDYLWEYEGRYVSEDLDMIITPYKDLCTCVTFMGGDQNIVELGELCERVSKEYGLKTCVYSGLPVTPENRALLESIHPDYYKIGEYDKNLGGLSDYRTNQRMYKRSREDMSLAKQKNIYSEYDNITKAFWKIDLSKEMSVNYDNSLKPRRNKKEGDQGSNQEE